MRSADLSITHSIAQAIERNRACRELNAIVAIDEERLMRAARFQEEARASGKVLGTLHGVAFAAKDNIDTVDLPTTACTPALRGNVPPRNAPVVQRLLNEGAMLFGKANMHELAFGITNNHGAFGPARNPHDPRLIPGGSSGGAAAAVAAGIVPFSLGTDTGGSARIPAALCGIAGFRPTVGRYPRDGVVPISRTRDTVGVMARTVADIGLVDAVISGDASELEGVELAGLRIGIPREYFYADLEPAVAARMDELLSSLKAKGVTLVEENIPEVGKLNEAVSFPVAMYEAPRCLAEYLAHSAPHIQVADIVAHIASPDVRPVYEAALNPAVIPEKVYREAIEIHRPALQRALAQYLDEHRLDAYLVPTCCLTARPIGHDETVELNARQVPTFFTYIRNTEPSSNAGTPGISVPIRPTDAGLPVGAMLEARAGDDRRLLAIASAIASASA
jgi:mandelamide amidase